MAIGRPSFVVKGGQTAELAEVLEGRFEPGGQRADACPESILSLTKDLSKCRCACPERSRRGSVWLGFLL